MAVSSSGNIKTWQRRTPTEQLVGWVAWLMLVAVFVFCWQVMTADTIWAVVSEWVSARIRHAII